MEGGEGGGERKREWERKEGGERGRERLRSFELLMESFKSFRFDDGIEKDRGGEGERARERLRIFDNFGSSNKIEIGKRDIVKEG